MNMVEGEEEEEETTQEMASSVVVANGNLNPNDTRGKTITCKGT